MPANLDDLNLDEPKTVDPIEKYLNETLGAETDGEASADASTEGSAQADQQSDQQQAPAPKAGDSSAKDGAGKQAPVKEGEKDKGKASAPGDLTLNDGTVVKAGAERRHYEKARLAESQLSMRTNELNQANARADRIQNELVQLKSTVSSLNGADPQVVSTGLKLVRDLQRDPTGTLKTLLTEAIAAGYTIDGIAPGIDAHAIRAEVLKQYEPLQQQLVQQQQLAQSDQQIEQEVTQFYTSYPDARIHDEVIAAVLKNNPQMSMSEAYYQLRNAVIDRNLDWSQPLAPQLSSEQQQQPTNQQAPKPMPNGKEVPAAQATSADRVAVAHESTDMGSIIKQAMRENGMKI